jgi:hypothetical protein
MAPRKRVSTYPPNARRERIGVHVLVTTRAKPVDKVVRPRRVDAHIAGADVKQMARMRAAISQAGTKLA